MILRKFEYLRPASIKEALELYDKFEGGAVYLSGGTDLVPRMKLGLERPSAVIDIKQIAPLKRVEDQGEWVKIGSLVPLFDLRQEGWVVDNFPALKASLDATSCETLQMRGTIGGNLLQNSRCLFYNQSVFWRKSKGFCFKMGGDKCNAVPGAKRCFANYCSDNATSLSTLTCELELSGPDGARRIALDELYSGKPGKPFKVRAGEILTAIFVKKENTQGGYEKLRLRGSIDYPLLGLAFSLKDGKGTLAVGAVGAKPRAVELTEFKKDSVKEAVDTLLKDLTPVNNTVVEASYRKQMVPVMAERLIKKTVEGA